MDRTEKVGLGVAAAGHVVLFGLLSVGFLATPNPLKLSQQPIDVSLVPEVAVESSAPNPAEAAQSVAPDVGAPEDAAAPEPVEASPEPQPEPAPAPPAPAPPKPQPAPPKPQPAPPKPAPKPEPKPQPKVEPKPAPKPVPRPKPQPPRPAPAAKPAPAKPAPAKPAPAKAAPAKPAPAKPVAKPATAGAGKPAATRPAASAAKPATAARGTGNSATAQAPRPRGGHLGNDFLKGLTDQPSKSNVASAAPAAKMGPQQAANIGSAIKRQVQPCANRQVTPGPGAERIQVTINLRLNRDGSLASRPRVIGHAGVDDDNRRYVDRVDDLAVATFVGCSPLKGLPDELYDVQNGWSNFSLRYKLPG